MSAPPARHAPRPDISPANVPPDNAPRTPGTNGQESRESGASLVDHDQAARCALGLRLITDIDRVHVLAGTHNSEHPDWREVTLLLGRLRATLSRELPPDPAGPP